MSVRWKVIKGYSNYAVSEMGQVRNLSTGTILRHQHSARGGNYAFINLCSNGKRVNRNVHILVAAAFLGPTPAGHIIHHKDHNRLNPALSNLSFETHADNRIK